jgi:NifU-like protein involved in Fe-S cluster formation
MEHFLAPRNSGRMDDPDVIGRGSLDGRAPYTEIFLKIADSAVQRASFTTFGCGVSIACASAATGLLAGRSLEECAKIDEDQIVAVLEEIPPDKQFCAGIVAMAVRDAVAQWSARASQSEAPE